MKNDYYDGSEIKDVSWSEVKDSNGEGNLHGEIKFRKEKRNSIFKSLIKGIAFVLIAAVSGGITGAYVSNFKYTNSAANNNQALFPSINNKNQNTSSNAITRVAEIVGPAVVGINNSDESLWGEENQGSASGIIFKSDGYIVTNYHVIKDSSKHMVKLSSGKNSKPLEAKVIGYDAMSDLAVIKVDAKNLPVAVFGDSSKVRVGDIAVAIGNPLGEEFAGSVTAGIISALNRELKIQDSNTGVYTTYKVLQTDAAINPGNSGGPLCNENGEVIGINSLKIGAKDNAEGMGFAISINEAKKIIESLMKSGHVSRPYLGIYPEEYTSGGNNKIKGILVKDVINNTGASKSGIKVNDIIIELDGAKLNSIDELRDIIERHKAGDTILCKIMRNGKTTYIKIVLSERPNTES